MNFKKTPRNIERFNMRLIRSSLIAAFFFVLFLNVSHAQEKRSPALSCLLSTLIPGVGQYYNGTQSEIIKGAIQDGLIAGALVLNRIQGASGTLQTSDSFNELFVIVGAYLWSVIDAPISAADINGEIDRKKRTSNDLKMQLTLMNDPSFKMMPMADLTLKF